VRDKFRDHLLEQYKLYVEMADRVSIRREQTNRFYVLLLSGLLAFFSIIIERYILLGWQNVLLLAVAIWGLLLCFTWYIHLRSYRQLNTGKFRVVHEMEQHLPFPCYNREWEILGRGRKAKKYLQLTRVEQYIPGILAIPYLLLLIYSICIIWR